jgi:hypothetical protein
MPAGSKYQFLNFPAHVVWNESTSNKAVTPENLPPVFRKGSVVILGNIASIRLRDDI